MRALCIYAKPYNWVCAAFEYNEDFMSEQQEMTPAWLEKAQQQWKLYAVVAVVVAAALGGIWWYTTNQAEQNEAAAAQLARIRPTFEEGAYQKALTGEGVPPVGADAVMGLQAISDQYSGTDAGKVAALMAGNCLANLGKYSEAEVHFDRARSSGSLIIEVGAMKGLAACKEAAGDVAGAAELYEQAAQRGVNTGMEGDCLVAAGLCYEKLGNKEKAGEHYTVVVKKYEVSEAVPAAKSGLARLGMAID
jgi:tetratricopeptide (TPR) repeat protein